MMGGVLLQLGQLTPVQRAVRDQFSRGGSLMDIAIVIAGLGGIIALTYIFARRQQRNDRSVRRFDPRQLFDALLRKLYVTADQRRWLEGVASGARLDHPAVLLLSEKLFDRYAAEWASRHSRTSGADGSSDTTAAQVRSLLFPTD